MREVGSSIAGEIMAEYRREKEYKLKMRIREIEKCNKCLNGNTDLCKFAQGFNGVFNCIYYKNK